MVLSKNDYNQRYKDVIVAAITSNISEREYQVIITNNEMAEGKLKVDSAIRADKIYTLSQSIVVRKFGKVQSDVIKIVKKQIENWS